MAVNPIVADEIKVNFSDGTSTILYVLDDENIRDSIVELCESEGWDMRDVSGYKIIGHVREADL